MARMTDAEARSVVLAAFAKRGIQPNLQAAQAVQAIGRFEGAYGSAYGNWKNWGAIQCTSAPPCPPNCVELTDTHADGTPYRWCYRVYLTHVDGAADLVRELYRRQGVPDALAAGDAQLIAKRMRATGYFEATEDRYAKAIANNAKEIADNLSEPLVVAIGGVPTRPEPGVPRPAPTLPTRPPAEGPRRTSAAPALVAIAVVGAFALHKARSNA